MKRKEVMLQVIAQKKKTEMRRIKRNIMQNKKYLKYKVFIYK